MALGFWPAWLATIYAFIRVFGILAAAHAIMKVRSAQSAIAWAFTLGLFPMVGLPLYLLLGSRKFRGYVLARRRGREGIQQVAKDLAPKIRPFMLAKSETDNLLIMLQNLVKLPLTFGNDANVLINGKATYNSMLAGLEEARSYVLFQFFIIENNRAGHEFKRKLIECANRGVRVYVLFDPLGSTDIGRGYLGELIEAGIQVLAFNSPTWHNRFRLNFRNHRKIVVVDGRHAWVGGLNIGDSYLGHGHRFRYWRDTHIKVTGPAVLPIQLVFLEDWYWASKSIPDLHWEPEASPTGNRKVLAMPTGPNDRLDTCELFFLQMINQAQNRLWITSPYFVPNDTIMAALQLAALRGVDVRIMIPKQPDHLLVYLSAFTYFREAERAGVKIFRYLPGFLHQKIMLVDEDLAVIGTANLDNRSLRINFEISLLFQDTEFADQIEQLLEADFNQCSPVEGNELAKKSIWFRLAARVARLLSPLQ